MVRGKSDNIVSEQSPLALNLIMKWYMETDLINNQSKTSLIIFSKRLIINFISPSIDNIPVNLVKVLKHLGVTLDSKLTWNTHINNIVNKEERHSSPINVFLVGHRNLI